MNSAGQGIAGKVIIISGGARGLGRALVERFEAEGASLAVIGKTAAGIETLQRSVKRPGDHLLWHGDISQEKVIKGFAEQAQIKFGAVDVIINNASILGPRISIMDYDIADWREVFKVNLEGTFLLTKAFLPGMIERRSGSIINVSSSVGRKGLANWGAYSASKFGLEGFTQILAQEVAEYGVKVNSVNPGGMATDMRHSAFPYEDPATLPSPSQFLDVYLYLAGVKSEGVSGKAFDARTFSL